MLARRSARVSRDYMFSPCLSSNRKQLCHLHSHQNPPIIGWSATGTDVVEDMESRATTGTSLTTEMLMMLGRKRDSSFGSCGPWSMASLMDKLPVTPSPICSPVSSSCSPPSELYFSQDSTDHSSAAKNQIPCIMNDRESPSHEELEKEKREQSSVEKQRAYDRSHQLKMSSMNSPIPMRKITTDTERFSQCYNCHKPTPNATMSTRSSGLHFLYEPTEYSDGGNYDGRLPAVSEEQEAIWHKKACHLGSSAVNCRPHFFSEDSSGYGSSDLESIMEEHLRSAARPIHGFESEIKRKEVEAKLMEWKEARTLKLVNKLRKKVTEISEWEKKQMTKAKMEMRKSEMKLEKKRAKALDKMQWRILSARKKAERKKVKERTAAVKKMAKISRAFKKIESTGKLPWKLIFL